MNDDSSPPSANARRYLAFFLLPILVIALCITGLLMFFRSRGELAAVPLTGNPCFNAKMEFLRGRPSLQQDVLAIGSSMTLNNLDTGTLRTHLSASTRYANTGAWGMKIRQTRELAQVLVPEMRPRVVLMVCGSMDFSRDDQTSINFDRADLLRFIRGQPYPLAVASHLDLTYYWKQAGLTGIRKGYDSLAFDEGGGVPLNVHFPAINPNRWNHTPGQVTPNPQSTTPCAIWRRTCGGGGLLFS